MLSFYIKYHAKFLAALSAPAALFAVAIQDGEVSQAEGSKVLGALGAALLVYLFPNAKIEDKPASRASLQAQIDALNAKLPGSQQ